ncbi:dimethylhistidine N-methyltransferase [Acidihalobacter yilgarnensis]|uniref:Dimethylhistidine N-methyltransferase n=1 Tax=Acidihalobacter yilgarnensis TaxID=2819280 RepID=A0A1D8INB7_9GAMM|nr:L-histidine N(alpha)-methyltransferase [Acidihalobacter yilgarnensis]AOU97963.1 dimethylhistidine N-methyltransferase [Acidihalobacter yilgarnensis]
MPLDASIEPLTIIDALKRSPARIASKYFYDNHGSELFELITRLPEYYPTRTELEILNQFGEDIALAIGQGLTLIELGAGNCEKSQTLCRLIQPSHFVAIDVAEEFVREGANRLRSAFPGLITHTVAADLAVPITLPTGVPYSKRVVFYPGSSIGNFDPADSLALLERSHALAGKDGALLIGVDLVKDPAILEAAYNDADGVTARFNQNILRHANCLIGSDFKPKHWRHVAFFNNSLSRIEMHLEAKTTTVVHWPGGERHFASGERIHTENSYKYTPKILEDRLRQAGFGQIDVWMDARRWFAIVLARTC